MTVDNSIESADLDDTRGDINTGMVDSDRKALRGSRVAIANRGEIAIRIASTCRRLGAIPILLLGEPDLGSYAARQVGRMERIGPAGSEFEVDLVVAAAQRASADYLHPGYGFLSERAALAEACARTGIVFIGPSPETLTLCGDKLATRNAAERAGVPVLPASSALDDNPQQWRAAARVVGYPLLVKPTGAGGGRGLRRVTEESGLIEAIQASRRESASSGAGSIVYLERELIEPRHVEVQVAGDGERTLALGDRDCSVQRRHQKLIEEAPAPNLDPELRRNLHLHAVRIGEVTGLRGIATCEFLLGADGFLAFLEVNPRIQVEHPVTELVTGLDLVEWQLRIASGEPLPIESTPEFRGHAIEARIYAEDPWNGFFPASGTLKMVSWPVRPDVRVDTGYATGDAIPSSYDPLIAKVIAHGSDRDAAIALLEIALLDTIVAGIPTNIPWLCNLLANPAIRAGEATTRTAADVAPALTDHRPALFGALALTLDDSRSAARDPWSAIGPWRQLGNAAITFHGESWDESVVVNRTTTGWEVLINQTTISLNWWRDRTGIWTIAVADDVMKLSVIKRGSDIEVAGHGGRWLVRHGLKPASKGDRYQRSHDGRIRAPLPARVLGIHVAVGDLVERAQPLVTITAMKIEMICEAPATGTVETISCRIDELVDSDEVMITLRID